MNIFPEKQDTKCIQLYKALYIDKITIVDIQN